MKQNFRLGYACICTELRKKNTFCSRTCRISTIQVKGIEYVKALALQNCKDLLKILHYNVKNGIFLMRISSDLFPFGSHQEYSYSLDFADEILKEIGKFAKDNSIRLTTHPGQYNVLSSPKQEVIDNTFRDLNHHCDFLDRMGLDQDSVMVIHGGGVYGNKTDALKRLEDSYLKLPKNTRDRIVLENCETNYSIEDLLPICEKLNIPLVVDFHHDDLNPSKLTTTYYFTRVFDIWKSRGIKPKVHVSNSCDNILPSDNLTKKRKHSDYISFIHDSLLSIDFDIDVMFEAKMKEQAIFRYLEKFKT